MLSFWQNLPRTVQSLTLFSQVAEVKAERRYLGPHAQMDTCHHDESFSRQTGSVIHRHSPSMHACRLMQSQLSQAALLHSGSLMSKVSKQIGIFLWEGVLRMRDLNVEDGKFGNISEERGTCNAGQKCALVMEVGHRLGAWWHLVYLQSSHVNLLEKLGLCFQKEVRRL